MISSDTVFLDAPQPQTFREPNIYMPPIGKRQSLLLFRMAERPGIEPGLPLQVGEISNLLGYHYPTPPYNVGFSRFCRFPRLVVTPSALLLHELSDLQTLLLYAGCVLNTGKHPGDFIRCRVAPVLAGTSVYSLPNVVTKVRLELTIGVFPVDHFVSNMVFRLDPTFPKLTILSHIRLFIPLHLPQLLYSIITIPCYPCYRTSAIYRFVAPHYKYCKPS